MFRLVGGCIGHLWQGRDEKGTTNTGRTVWAAGSERWGFYSKGKEQKVATGNQLGLAK